MEILQTSSEREQLREQYRRGGATALHEAYRGTQLEWVLMDDATWRRTQRERIP